MMVKFPLNYNSTSKFQYIFIEATLWRCLSGYLDLARDVDVYFQLREDGVPDDVEAPEEVPSEERGVEVGEVLREEVREGTDGLLGREVLRRPGQVKDVLLDPRLQLQISSVQTPPY